MNNYRTGENSLVICFRVLLFFFYYAMQDAQTSRPHPLLIDLAHNDVGYEVSGIVLLLQILAVLRIENYCRIAYPCTWCGHGLCALIRSWSINANRDT